MARYIGAVDRCKVGGRGAQALDLAGITDTVGCPRIPKEEELVRSRCGYLISRVPHFSRSLREVGLFADTLPTLSQRSAEFCPPTKSNH